MENGNAGKLTTAEASERVLSRHLPPVRPDGRDGGPPRRATRSEGVLSDEVFTERESVVKNTETGVEREMAGEQLAAGQMEQTSAEGMTMPILPPTESAITDTGTVEDMNPVTAEDGEKIEKEWAERIQKIIALTKDDPRTEQIEVNKLKADYLKKRFNREIGDRN